MTAARVRQTRHAAAITPETLAQCQEVIRVWDSPRSRLEGARIVDAIIVPTRVYVVAEQHERCSETPERVRICYQGKAAWVLAVMLTRESC